MRICHMPPEWFHHDGVGGIATYARTVAATAIAHGHEVVVLTVQPRSEAESATTVRIVPVVAQGLKATDTAAAFACALAELCRSWRPDVVEAAEFGGVAAEALHQVDVPVVTRLHTPLSLILHRGEQAAIYPDDEDRCRLEREQARRSVLVTSPTEWLAGVVHGMWSLAVRPTVIPNPVLPAAALGEQSPGDRLRVLYVGRLEHRKGVLVLARAVRQWVAEGGAGEVTLVGGDTRWHGRPMTERIVEELGPAAGAVTLRPHARAEELHALLASTDVVVIPSLYENFPYSCVEAMAVGRAVIASSGSGLEEIVEDGVTGMLVPPGDAEALTDALARAAADRTRLAAMGRAALASVDRFHADAVVPRLVEAWEYAIS